MKTAVTILAGRHRGKTGWIHGDLGHLAPGQTKAWVRLGGGYVALAIAKLSNAAQEPAQLELALPETKKARRQPEGRRRV